MIEKNSPEGHVNLKRPGNDSPSSHPVKV